MALRYFRSFNTGDIASGGSAEIEWTPDEAIHIKHIFIVERSSQTLDNVQVYIKTPSRVLTRDYVPALVLGHSMPYALDLDVDVAAGEKIYVKIVNNKTNTINLDVVFEITS